MDDNEREDGAQATPAPPLSAEFLSCGTAAGLEKIRARLLDLTNRNRLPNFRHTRASIRIVDADPDAVVDEKPRMGKDHTKHARVHCWSAAEARDFLAAAAKESEQFATFLHVALDTGARRSELAALLWSDVDFDAATLSISKQLDHAGETPVFGVTKTGKARVVALNADTVARLKRHSSSQAALKMKNRTGYEDHGLVFAKEHGDRRRFPRN